MARRALLVFFVLALTVAASATRIQISEPACNSHSPNPVYSVNDGFSIVPTSVGQTETFCNLTGQDWTSLLLTINETDVPAADRLTASEVLCGGKAFAYCQVTENSDDTMLYAFWAGVIAPYGPPINFPGFPGVPNDHSFTVDLQCSSTAPCGSTPLTWPTGIIITGSANTPTPEPASLVLLGSGIAAGLFRRKYRK